MSDDDQQDDIPDEGDERSSVKRSEAERAILDDPSKPRKPRGESKKNRIEREHREADVFWCGVLADPIGRRELWRIVAGSDGAHAFETRFPCGPAGVPDPNAAWHAKGEQDLGLRLYHAWLARDPSAVALMHLENDSRFAKRKGG